MKKTTYNQKDPYIYGSFLFINKKNQKNMQKTLGGDRLGAGNKMKVNLHGYERSTFDLGYLWRSTMAAGTLVPFMSKVVLPGDTFDINLDCDIKTHPTVGPLFGSYKVQLDVFLAPIRLYNSLLHNNMLGIGLDMSKVKLPVIPITAHATPAGTTDLDNSQVNPSSLPAYFGIRGAGITTLANSQRLFNAVPILAYWEIYKNYYANKQEGSGAVIHTPAPNTVTITSMKKFATSETDIPEAPTVGNVQFVLGNQIRMYYTGATQPDPNQFIINTAEHGEMTAQEFSTGVWNSATGYIWSAFRQTFWGNTSVINWRYATAADMNGEQPKVAFFPLTNIDQMRKDILAEDSETNPFVVGSLTPYGWLTEYNATTGRNNILSSQEGLAIKTYNSDLLNNWLKTDWIDGVNGISAITAISTASGSFTIDTLNISKKVYEMLNSIAVSGGSYDDWLDAVYREERYRRAESPMYMGGLIKELVFQEVVSNSEQNGQPLGTLAGKGVLAKKHKGGKVVVKVDEPGYIIGIISLTPRLDYSQGNSWDMNLQTLDDLHKPALDEIGFQELITDQMAWWDTHGSGTDTWTFNSAGKQPAWINYMTSINETRGNFAIQSNEMFMTLNRRYTPDANKWISDLTTYIDPSKYNFIFAETAIDSQNFWAQIAVDITARRKMSSKLMPNL